MIKDFSKTVVWIVVILVVGSFLVWGLMASNIISLGIQREATQHSQPYTETKVSLLNKLQNDWYQLNSEIIELRASEGNQEIIQAKQAQQKNIIYRMREEAQLIPDHEVPATIKAFLSSK